MSIFELKTEFIESVESVMQSNMAESEKKRKINNLVQKLDILDKRVYIELCRLFNARLVSDKCNKKDSGKLNLIEIDNMNQEFVHQMMFISMIHYVFARFEDFDYPGRYKKHVRRFIEHAFGNIDNKHLGPIYELFRQNVEQNGPTSIPTSNDPTSNDPTSNDPTSNDPTSNDPNSNKTPKSVSDELSKVLQDVRPSFEQWNNAFTFMTGNYEEMRTMTSALFGSQPTIESRIRSHGVFDNQKEVDEYRIKEAENIDGIAYSIPVGKNVLTDPFRDVREETVIYNPNDPEFEKLSRQNTIRKRVERQGMLHRIKQSERASKEESQRLQKLQSTLNSVDKKIQDPKTSKEEYIVVQEYKNELNKALNKYIDSAIPDNVVPLKVGNEERLVPVELYDELKKQTEYSSDRN